VRYASPDPSQTDGEVSAVVPVGSVNAAVPASPHDVARHEHEPYAHQTKAQNEARRAHRCVQPGLMQVEPASEQFLDPHVLLVDTDA
jgi:hypothetical protein